MCETVNGNEADAKTASRQSTRRDQDLLVQGKARSGSSRGATNGYKILSRNAEGECPPCGGDFDASEHALVETLIQNDGLLSRAAEQNASCRVNGDVVVDHYGTISSAVSAMAPATWL